MRSKINVGPGLDPDTDMGPLVSEEQFNRVCGYLEVGHRQRGEGALSAAQRTASKGYFVKPTVLVNTNQNMKVVQEEIFGPVVTAIPFKDPDESDRTSQRYRLRSGGGRLDARHQESPPLAAQLRAGTVWINCYNVFDAALPFGGYKQSGWGREMGHEVLELYTEVKSVCAAL